MAEAQAQDAEQQQRQQQQAAFPPPPSYFRLFRDGANATDSSGEAAEPPLRPPPLPAPDSTFQMFGELHTAQPGIPPLAVRQMYDIQPDGTIDFRAQLLRLNRELLFAFVDMLAAISKRPSQSARSVELVGVLARNIQYLLNLLRPHQAAATLEHLLRREIREQQEAIADLRERREHARKLVSDAAEALAAADSEPDGTGTVGDAAAAMEVGDDALGS